MSNQINVGVRLFENLRSKICLQCGNGKLKQFFVIDQETSASLEYWHTIIAACAECGKGQLERTYHDSSDSEEIFDHSEWFLFDESSMERLHEYVEQKDIRDKKFSKCPEPLSPKCLCNVHWLLTEAARKLEPLTDAELRDQRGITRVEFVPGDNFPEFIRHQEGG